MKNERVTLIQTLARNPGASPEVIAKTEAQLGVSFPADYREFLLFSNGAEGAIGDSYLALWSVKEIIPLNEGYGSRQFAPGLLLFGGDGGGMGYGFDTRVSPMPVYEVDYVVMRIEDGWFRGRTFTEFLRHMAGVPATTTPLDML